MRRKNFYVAVGFSILSILFSVCILIVGITYNKEYTSVKDYLISVPATVSKISRRAGYESESVYLVKVTYRYNSKVYEQVLETSAPENKYHINETVYVTINPAAPNKIYKEPLSIEGCIIGALVSLGMGVGFGGLAFYEIKIKNKPKQC